MYVCSPSFRRNSIASIQLNFSFAFCEKVAILVGTGISGISCVLHNIPILQIGPLLIHIVLCGLAGNILNAAAVEIYPTANRGMAVCISLMFARVGGVCGAYVVSLLLETQCEILFGLSGSLLIGKRCSRSRYITLLFNACSSINEIRNENKLAKYN